MKGIETMQVRVIVCLIRGMTHFARDTLRLAEKYRGEGVVGIDIAGDEASCAKGDTGSKRKLRITVVIENKCDK